MAETRYVRFLGELGLADVPLVGGKNASLGELHRALAPQGILVPNGFALTADAYRTVLARAGAWEKLHAALGSLDPSDVAELASDIDADRARQALEQAERRTADMDDVEAEAALRRARLRVELAG